MHLVVLIIQWITGLVILFELAVIFINIGNRVYSLLYMLCTSMLVSAYGYLLHLYSATEEALLMTMLVSWAGKIFAMVVSWRFCLSVCDCEFPKRVQITDQVCLALVLTGLTTTKMFGFFFSDFKVLNEGSWHILQYHKGIGYYQFYIFVICALIFMIRKYIQCIRESEDNDRKKKFLILLVATLFSPGMSLLSLLPVGDYYDFGQIGFLASSVTMVIAMVKYNIGDIEQFTKDYMFNELSSGVIATEKGGKSAFYNKIAASIFPELETNTEQVVEKVRDVISSGETITFGDNIYSPEEKTLENKSTLFILTDSTKHFQHIKEVEEQKIIAESANKAKSEFLANMSHEIRTPINTVLGMDEMILRESREDAIRNYALDIQSAGRSLLSIINDILDLSKIEAGKMEIIPIEYDVPSALNDLSNMIRFRAEDKGLDFQIVVSPDIPSRMYGDDIRIRQVIMNLLTNAFKYTETGSIWFRVALAEGTKVDSDTATLHFEVEDTGIGIKPEDMKKLFSDFERIDLEHNRSIEGTGLGIPITMRLLELMGSKLNVQSEYGKGTLFYFDLTQKVIDPTPIGNFEETIRNSAAQQYSYNRSFIAPDARILLVDDNTMNRRVFTALLKQTQMVIDEADGGQKAVDMAAERYYDIIFMDHMMPGMDGVEAMKRIKAIKDGPCADTPIIVLTANAVTGAREQYFEDGFDGFLSKPVAADKLENAIRENLPEDKLLPAPKGEEQPAQSIAAPDVSEYPTIIGLDWKYALMRLQDKGVLDSVLGEFYSSIDIQADKLQSFRDGLPGSVEDYGIMVHGMKSASGSIGLVGLSGMAEMLERAAADKDVDTIEQIHDVFIKEWRSYKERLRDYVTSGDGSAEDKEMIDDAILDVLLRMLSDSMAAMDIDGADDAIAKLAGYKLPDHVAAVFDELRGAVTSLDQEAVERILNSIS